MNATFFTEPVQRPDGLTEISRRTGEGGATLEDMIQAGFRWDDLAALARKSDLVRLSETAYVCVHSLDGESLALSMIARERHRKWIQLSRHGSPDSLLVWSVNQEEPTDVLRQLFRMRALEEDHFWTVSPAEDPAVDDEEVEVPFPLSDEMLAFLLHTSRNCARLEFGNFSFLIGACRELATATAPLCFFMCSFADNGRLIFEVIETGQGPKTLILEYMNVLDLDSEALLRAIANSESLRHLVLDKCLRWPRLFDPSQIFRALGDNHGLVSFFLGYYPVRDVLTNENWLAMLQCLRSHPTLESFGVESSWAELENGQAARVRRTRQVVEMLAENGVLSEFDVSYEPERHDEYERPLFDQQMYIDQVVPLLELNPLRPHIQLVEDEPDTIRNKLVSSVLAHPVVQRNPSYVYSCFWSNNQELLLQRSERHRRMIEEEIASVGEE